MADDLSMNPTRDDFAALLDESMGGSDFHEGTVVKGRVAAIEKDIAIIDVGQDRRPYSGEGIRRR